jgi:predicted phosphodiesterase
MRIALFADIHGNSIALDAVLADIHAQGNVDEYWILGDLAAIGHDPIGVLERVTQIPKIRFTRGNTDRYLVTGERPKPTFDEVQQDPALLTRFVEVGQNFAWTQGVLAGSRWFDWLADLPIEQRLVLPNNTRLLGVHASPGNDNGRGVYPGIGEEELAMLLRDCNADLVCVAHTHFPVDVLVNGIRVINLGSVSNTFLPDLRASYVIIDADKTGYRIEPRRVDYDREAVITALHRLHHPASTFIEQYMRGQHIPNWNKYRR